MLIYGVKMLSNGSLTFDYKNKNGKINNVIARIEDGYNSYKGFYIVQENLIKLNSVEFLEIYRAVKVLFNQVEKYKAFLKSYKKDITLTKFDIINKNLVKFNKYKNIDYDSFFNSVKNNFKAVQND